MVKKSVVNIRQLNHFVMIRESLWLWCKKLFSFYFKVVQHRHRGEEAEWTVWKIHFVYTFSSEQSISNFEKTINTDPTKHKLQSTAQFTTYPSSTPDSPTCLKRTPYFLYVYIIEQILIMYHIVSGSHDWWIFDVWYRPCSWWFVYRSLGHKVHTCLDYICLSVFTALGNRERWQQFTAYLVKW